MTAAIIVTHHHHHRNHNLDHKRNTRSIIIIMTIIWVNYNISLTWIKAIWGWFPLITIIPVRSQWGRYNLPRIIVITITSPNSTYHSIRPFSWNHKENHIPQLCLQYWQTKYGGCISQFFLCQPTHFAEIFIEVAASSASGSHAQHQWPRNNLPCVRALSGAVLCSTSLLKHGFIPKNQG